MPCAVTIVRTLNYTYSQRYENMSTISDKSERWCAHVVIIILCYICFDRFNLYCLYCATTNSVQCFRYAIYYSEHAHFLIFIYMYLSISHAHYMIHTFCFNSKIAGIACNKCLTTAVHSGQRRWEKCSLHNEHSLVNVVLMILFDCASWYNIMKHVCTVVCRFMYVSMYLVVDIYLRWCEQERSLFLLLHQLLIEVIGYLNIA